MEEREEANQGTEPNLLPIAIELAAGLLSGSGVSPNDTHSVSRLAVRHALALVAEVKRSVIEEKNRVESERNRAEAERRATVNQAAAAAESAQKEADRKQAEAEKAAEDAKEESHKTHKSKSH